MTLPPGRYQLRVAGGTIAGTAAGSVMYDLAVPDFAKAPLAMSAPSLSSRHARDAFTPRVEECACGTSACPENGPAVHKFEASLPLDVPPGPYTLHVEARSTLTTQPPVSRDIPLRVR